MEKWKVGVVMVVVGGLVGYGAWQRQQSRLPAEQTIKQFVGKPLPSWNIPANYWINTKRALEPNDFKGNVTLVEFFLIRCPHCQEASPQFKKLLTQYGSRGFKVVAIHSPGRDPVENNWAGVKTELQKTWKVSYPVAFDQNRQLFKGAYQGKTYPSVFVLDRQGVVRYANTGYDAERAKQLEDAIKEELAKTG